jgi:hypothetical protein
MSPLLRLCALAIVASISGCDSLSSDISNMTSSFMPPSGAQVGTWATDFTNPEEQQKGLVLLGTATWGGGEEYLKLYRTCIEGPWDPLVKAAAIRSLGNHGEPEDAILIATQLDDEIEYVRLEAAKSLQRIHNDEVADDIWRRLVIEKDSSIKVELAIALGQYPNDGVFQALAQALEMRELAVNLAAWDSLRYLTGENHGSSAREWLAWYETTTSPFAGEEIYLYPVYTRPLGFFDTINFFNPTVWEKPGIPTGLQEAGRRSTWTEVDPPPPSQKGA